MKQLILCYHRNVFIVRMIERTSRDSFNHDLMKHVQNGGHLDRRRVPLRFKLRPTRDQMFSLNMDRCSDTTAIIGDGLS